MNNFNFNDCRKAVNQVTFRPTAQRKAAAMKLLQEAMDFITNLEEVKETKPKAKKRRRKTTKRTPSQKVADQMDRASLKTNEVGPIKPKAAKPKASVSEAAESAKAVSEHTGAAAKAAKKAEAKQAEAVQPKVDDSRLSSLEEKIEMLTQLVALQMQSEPTHTIDTISIDELPFQL
jgi:hypothetical protein